MAATRICAPETRTLADAATATKVASSRASSSWVLATPRGARALARNQHLAGPRGGGKLEALGLAVHVAHRGSRVKDRCRRSADTFEARIALEPVAVAARRAGSWRGSGTGSMPRRLRRVPRPGRQPAPRAHDAFTPRSTTPRIGARWYECCGPTWATASVTRARTSEPEIRLERQRQTLSGSSGLRGGDVAGAARELARPHADRDVVGRAAGLRPIFHGFRLFHDASTPRISATIASSSERCTPAAPSRRSPPLRWSDLGGRDSPRRPGACSACAVAHLPAGGPVDGASGSESRPTSAAAAPAPSPIRPLHQRTQAGLLAGSAVVRTGKGPTGSRRRLEDHLRPLRGRAVRRLHGPAGALARPASARRAISSAVAGWCSTARTSSVP